MQFFCAHRTGINSEINKWLWVAYENHYAGDSLLQDEILDAMFSRTVAQYLSVTNKDVDGSL